VSDRRPLSGSDYVFPGPLPRWLPAFLRRFLRDLQYDELHAAELGLVGAAAGVAAWAGMYAAVVGFSLAVFGVAFGLRRADPEGSIPWASRVLRREPWYFVVVYAASAGAGYAAAAFQGVVA